MLVKLNSKNKNQRELVLHINKLMREALDTLRSDIKLWSVPEICGQDSYAGLPRGMRLIDATFTKVAELEKNANK